MATIGKKYLTIENTSLQNHRTL